MKLYAQADFDRNKWDVYGAWGKMILMMIPCIALAVAGWLMRQAILCAGGMILAGAMCIFMMDWWIRPAWRYGRYLVEIHSGLSHEIVGTLMRIGKELVYEDGVDFIEVILNVYEDLSVEGERRFLLDAKKKMPEEWVGQDIRIVNHGHYILAEELCRATEMEQLV